MIDRVLIVGYGSIGSRHLRLLRDRLPQADIRILRHKFSDSLPIEANGVFFKIEDALKEFDGDYDIEELRLMRIKFISEVAN